MSKNKKSDGANNKDKYKTPLSMNTWEEKMAFLKLIHEEIKEKKENVVYFEENATNSELDKN